MRKMGRYINTAHFAQYSLTSHQRKWPMRTRNNSSLFGTLTVDLNLACLGASFRTNPLTCLVNRNPVNSMSFRNKINGTLPSLYHH